MHGNSNIKFWVNYLQTKISYSIYKYSVPISDHSFLPLEIPGDECCRGGKIAVYFENYMECSNSRNVIVEKCAVLIVLLTTIM